VRKTLLEVEKKIRTELHVVPVSSFQGRLEVRIGTAWGFETTETRRGPEGDILLTTAPSFDLVGRTISGRCKLKEWNES
jgi:hypothetical protein